MVWLQSCYSVQSTWPILVQQCFCSSGLFFDRKWDKWYIFCKMLLWRWCDGTLAVFDIEESGKQIGEKLFLLLNEEQKNALMQYILEQGVCHGTVFNSCHTSFAAEKNPLTEIQEGELYLCLEHRTVRVRERIINLTSKEFDILALLIANPKRVFTYELITDLVWKEDCDFYSRKAIHNHISKLRKKLRFEPDLPNYIESVAGIGYKFEHL